MNPPNTGPDRIGIENLSTTIYSELRARGAGMMRDERTGHTLSPTALVNEAVARLIGTEQRVFNDRAHLLAAAALAMRRVLVEHARARGRVKRGGRRGRVEWDRVAEAVASQSDPDLLLDLDAGVEALGAEHERYGRLVVLRLFGAMTNEEIAGVLGVSLGTVEKDWRYAKARLRSVLSGEGLSGSGDGSPEAGAE